MADELLTISQAAKLFGVSRHTLASQVQRGDIPALRMPPTPTAPKGYRLLVKRSDVEAVLPTIQRRPGRQKPE